MKYDDGATSVGSSLYLHEATISCLLSILQHPIDVTLSPPPDLVVSSIIVGKEHTTGSVMVIKYTVTNNGAGAPFESFWTDTTVSLFTSVHTHPHKK